MLWLIFRKHWYEDTIKDLKKLESILNINENLEIIFINLFYTIIELNKGNLKNFIIQIDNLLVKINKLNPEMFNNVIICLKIRNWMNTTLLYQIRFYTVKLKIIYVY